MVRDAENRPMPEKRPSYSRSVGVSGVGWHNLHARKSPCRNTSNGHSMMCISADFWHSGQYLGVFSTGSEMGDFTGFSGDDQNPRKGNGACIGRILLQPGCSVQPGSFPGRPEVSIGCILGYLTIINSETGARCCSTLHGAINETGSRRTKN